MKLIYKFFIVLFLAPCAITQAQNKNIESVDSLSLSQILNDVIHNYPSIKKAQSDVESSSARIDLAKANNLPDINLTSSYTFIGPTTTISIPQLGSFQMNPANNYSAMINITQSIYDFGKTSRNITFEKQNKELVAYSVDILKQKLSLMMVNNYYSIVYLQEAIRIKDEQLSTLNEHLRFIQKKEETGTATKFEILTTKVRISNVETQKTDLEAALQVQLSQLNSFLGKSQNIKLALKKVILSPELIASNDSLFAFAYNHRCEIKIANQKNVLNETRQMIVNNQNNPTLNLNASGGIKNGYAPELNKATPNFAIGIGLRVPIYDGSRKKHNQIQIKSDIEGSNQETELTRRNIANEVTENRANTLASLKKVGQSKLQLEQALEANALAKISFKSGTITNVELLDSNWNVTDSELALLKTKIDYSVNLYKLKIALGEQIY